MVRVPRARLQNNYIPNVSPPVLRNVKLDGCTFYGVIYTRRAFWW